jgi:2,3-bisphosphoglycerate-independent phosphoglycerate mutase
MDDTSQYALNRHSPSSGPVVLVIMDGVGVGAGDDYDAVARARTPNLDELREGALYRTLRAHGESVGLPTDGDMGNSEVGHNILGAGRIFDQGAKCVDSAVSSGAIWNDSWDEVVAAGCREGQALHLLGLLSDGNVHSSLDHLEIMIRRAAEQGARRVFVHGLLDGRDVPDHSAEEYIARVESILRDVQTTYGGVFQIASGGGRMTTTMDRYDANWSVVERGWRAHVLGEGRRFPSALEALEVLRSETPGISDQQLSEFVVEADGQPIGSIGDGDAVVVFNFRGDRVAQICRAFVEGDTFDAFDRVRLPTVTFAGMVQYDGDVDLPPRYLVSPETVGGTISEYLAANKIAQFACAETQKYGHVTYFWNGNRSGKFNADTETYLQIPSDTVPFEQRPWMKSAETADAVIEAVASGRYSFVRTNLAGGDMVGHTGDLRAAEMAVESVDLAVGRIAHAVQKVGGTLIVTADHGNADDMVERDKGGGALTSGGGGPRWRTAHSLNPVPCLIQCAAKDKWVLRDGLNHAGLANMAATVVDLLGYTPPVEYEPSLVIRKQ